MQEAHLKFSAHSMHCSSPCNPTTRCDHKTISEDESHIDWPLVKKSIELFFSSSRYHTKKYCNARKVKGTQVKIHLFFHFCIMHLFPVLYNLCTAAATGTAGRKTQLSYCLEYLPFIV